MPALDRTAAIPRPAAADRAARRVLDALPGPRDGVIAIANGLFGDLLDERGSALATPMTIRVDDAVLPLERRALTDALARAGTRVRPRVCVLVHGLMSTESIWRFPDDASATYGSLLADEHDLTVLSVRYNTGRHISANGRELARLLQLLVRAWPVRVREVDLIGHSMGGLVVRSACHYARRTRPVGRSLPIGRPWTSKLRRVVLIGVPNTGAGLEALVNSASAALWALPVPPARIVALGLDRRSAGIKDLRFGAILDEDWLERDPDARDRSHPHRRLRLRRTGQLLVVGSVSADPDRRVARLLGDVLVTSASATGRSTDGEMFAGATTKVFPRVTHNALAHHPEVFDALTEWW